MATIKNAVDLSTQAETDIADNTTQEISAEDERSLFLNIIASTLNIKDGGLVIQAQAGYNSAITPSSNYAFSTKKYVDDSISGIDLSALWNKSGNTLASRGTFGSLAGSAYGWDFKVNNVTKGAISNAGYWVFGGDTPYTSQTTTVTFKGTGTTSATNTIVALNDSDAPIFRLRDDGGFFFYEDLYDSTTKFLNIANRLFYTSGSVGALALNEFALYPNNSFSSLEWDLRICKDSNNDEVFDWENLEFTKNWKFNGNLGLGGASYGGGTQQYFQAESGTPSATAPTGGIRKQVVNGAEFTLLPSGENICTAGKIITDSDDYTQTVGVVKMKYTGTGGHTFTMHTAVGYAGSSYVIKNSGSGNLTIDANSTETIDGNLTEVVPAGESRVLYSDGSNLFII